MVQKKIKKKFGMKFQGVGEIVVLNCKVDRQPPFCTNSKKKKKDGDGWYGMELAERKNKNMKFSAKRDDNDI
ncbi:MAG: hypothetical protein M5E90_07525 [Asgard group archaeon]|nr:hypothetical protein [Asgard group archaeon]